MKKYLLWTFVIGLIGFSACSDDLSPEGNNPGGNQPSSSDGVDVYISLQKPGMGAVPYSTIWIDKEADVDTLDVYVFSDKTERTGYAGKFTLEKIVPQDTSRAVSSAGNITLQLKLDGRSHNRRLYFIANGSSINSLMFLDEIGWTTEEEFLAALTNATPQKTPLLMTAVVAITASKLQTEVVDDKLTLTEEILLKRTSARIDIENHERLLIIDSVQMFNTPAQSYIFGQAQNAFQAGVTGITSWPTIDIKTHKKSDGIPDSTYWKKPELDPDPSIGDSVYIPSLYFPYESFANGDETQRPRLRIWGRIGSEDLTQPGTGSDVTYEVPLQATGDSIARNHRYILLIRNVLGSEINAEFKVKPWEVEENDTIIKEVDADYPSITTLDGNRLTGKTLYVLKAGGVITLKVDCNIQWDIEFEGEEGSTATNWITPVIAMDETGTAATGSDIGKYLQLTFTANATTEDRGYGKVWIKVYNKAEPGKMYRFTVKQYGA